MDSVEQVMKGLTKEWRQALLRHTPFYGSRNFGWPDSAHDPLSFQNVGRPMMDAGYISWTNDPRSSRTQLTDRGRTLRARLLSSSRATDHAQ